MSVLVGCGDTPTSAAIAVQQAAALWLSQAAWMPAAMSVIARRDKEIANEIDAALAKIGACYFVFPPIEEEIEESEVDDQVFVTRASLIVQCIEQPTLNTSGLDVWQLKDKAAGRLHRKCLGVLPYPMLLARNPVVIVPDEEDRILNVRLICQYEWFTAEPEV